MCSKVERLRAGAEEFLDKSLGTDACLMFSPSQVSKILFEPLGSQLCPEFTSSPEP